MATDPRNEERLTGAEPMELAYAPKRYAPVDWDAEALVYAVAWWGYPVGYLVAQGDHALSWAPTFPVVNNETDEWRVWVTRMLLQAARDGRPRDEALDEARSVLQVSEPTLMARPRSLL